MIPPDFQLRKADRSLGAQGVARLLDEARLANKQLFYFTVPHSLPITVVEHTEVAISGAREGQAVLTHDGQDYGLSSDERRGARTIKILVPSEGGDKYSIRTLLAPCFRVPANMPAVDRDVDQTVHVKRVTKYLPGADAVNRGAGPSPNAPRPQPEGLKNRFLPHGIRPSITVRAPSPILNDPNSPVPPSSQLTVAAASARKQAKKRKHDGTEDSPRKRAQTESKREKTSKQKRKAAEKDSDSDDEAAFERPHIKTSLPKKAKQSHTASQKSTSAILPPIVPTRSEPKMGAPAPATNGVPPPRKITPVPPPRPGQVPSVPSGTKPQASKSNNTNNWANPNPTKQTAVPLPPYARQTPPVSRSSAELVQEPAAHTPKSGKKKKDKKATLPSSSHYNETPVQPPNPSRRHVQ